MPEVGAASAALGGVDVVGVGAEAGVGAQDMNNSARIASPFINVINILIANPFLLQERNNILNELS